jgi:hypothetical protein
MKKMTVNLFMLVGLTIVFAVSFIVLLASMIVVCGMAIIVPISEKLSIVVQRRLCEKHHLPFYE